MIRQSPHERPAASQPLTARPSPWAIGLVALLTLSACERREIDVSAVPDRAQKTLGDPSPVAKECRQLVTIINESVASGTKPASHGPASTELARLASNMEDTIARLNRVDLTDDRLQGLAERYRAMASKIGSSAKGLKKAIEAFDPRRMQASEQSFQAALQLEGPLMTELDDYCQKRR